MGKQKGRGKRPVYQHHGRSLSAIILSLAGFFSGSEE